MSTAWCQPERGLIRGTEHAPKRKHEAHLNVMPPTPGFQRDLSAQKCMQIPGTIQREQAITLRKGRTRHRKACVGLDTALKRKNRASTPSGRETGKHS